MHIAKKLIDKVLKEGVWDDEGFDDELQDEDEDEVNISDLFSTLRSKISILPGMRKNAQRAALESTLRYVDKIEEYIGGL